MRRLTSILLTLCTFATIVNGAHTYKASSVLSSGNIVKLQVPTTDIYCLSYEQIQALGLNPVNVRILGYGGNLIEQDFTQDRIDDVPSVPFYMHKGADGVFSPGDYILFYAQGPVGWQWGGAYYKRTRNCYADFGCYFISDDAGEQLLLNVSDTLHADDALDIYHYTALQLHEQDQRNLVDVNQGAEGGGREWYGEMLTPQNASLSIPFEFSDVDASRNLICYVDEAASSSVKTYLTVRVAGVSKKDSIAGIEATDFYSMAKVKTTLIQNAYPNSNSLPVSLLYQSSNVSSKAYLNYIIMQVPCFMRLRGNYLMIRNTEHLGESQLSRYHLLGADANTQIWNMTHPERAYLASTEWRGDTLCWLGSNMEPQLFIAVNPNGSGWAVPASRGKVANQNLHTLLRGKNHVILTPEAFRGPAERLKQAHETLTPDEHWEVVSDEQVYNEFSSGTPDASAIRWMMKYMYDTAEGESDRPRSLLLMGDGTFDNRQLLKTSGTATLLTYQAHNSTVETNAYATDDYFGWLMDNAGVIGSSWDDKRARMQIGVGRLPVNSYEEADQVVNKLIAYMLNASPSNWKQQLCFLADDGNSGMHVTTADVAAELVRAQAPEYIINKIYLDSYTQESSASGESYPLALNTYTNLLQSGVMLMDYAGHGSANNICSEMFLTRSQVEKMTNTNQGVWALATCNFAHFDMKDISTAEVAVINPVGGAIAVVSSDRTVYASENEILNKYFCENLFHRDNSYTYPYTIGEALRLAKNKNGDSMNKLPFVLLGDPALRLNYPTPYVVRINQMPDTIHALDLVTIHGYISQGDRKTAGMSDTVPFNGTMSITIFDKIQTVYTKDNDEQEESKKVIRSFEDYPNKLFVGEASVVNGIFSLEFRMPKDIRYNIGFGKLCMYATGIDEQGPAEALGYNDSVSVGGSSPWILDDAEGPQMHIYLNTPLFVSGDEVNPTPHFYAELYDINGINTVGSGIGHDLMMILDDNAKQTYILNNYYKSKENSYQEGEVSYLLPTMADGDHKLMFRAWDMPGNASTQTINFSVNSQLGPAVKELVVYPNPVSHNGELNMYMTTDRPDDILSIQISFYSTLGQCIWTKNETMYTNTISFDLSETNIPAGTYIYQFTIQTTTQSSSKHTGRVIVY